MEVPHLADPMLMESPRANDAFVLTAPHEAAHTPAAVRARLRSGPSHNYLRDFIYGAVDGTVTTFAIVAGVEGAGLAPGIVVVLGVANLVADGFSMAASNFLATRAEHQQREKARRREELEIERFPEGEREEIRQIFASKGFQGDDLDRVVRVITSDGRRWVNTMLTEELGLSLHGPSAWRAGLVTFAAFGLVGLLPLLPFLGEFAAWRLPFHSFYVSSVATGISFAAIGACKSRFTGQRWHAGALETLGVGGAAAALAFVVGLLLRNVM